MLVDLAPFMRLPIPGDPFDPEKAAPGTGAAAAAPQRQK
jgi:hypothetical protein